MTECLICNHTYEPFLSFGQMPIANNFLTEEQFDNEYFYELRIGVCGHCHMVQLLDQPSRDMMFHENYAYFSSTSAYQVLHFKALSEKIIKEHCRGDAPFVVELGSNDGIMLENFAKAKIRHLGVEPSESVAKAASAKGINTVCEFFDQGLAQKIIQDYGQADAITAANVMCHIPYLHSVIDGIKLLLKPTGIFCFEDPYLGDILEKTAYDQIYDEHAFYFSYNSLSYLMKAHDLEIIDVIPLNVHGGSMRYVVAHKGAQPVKASVEELAAKEMVMGLNQPASFSNFRKKVESSKDKLISLLKEIRYGQGKRIVGYGATSKSTTVTNFCGIGPDLVEFISDTTPGKQWKFSPGTHIPVKSYHDFSSRYPEYALLFAWNHSREIMAKETAFEAFGGKWIGYVPRVGVLP